MNDELEPLDPELALLYGADKAAEDAVSAAMQARIHAAVLAQTSAGAALAVKAASPSLWSAKIALLTTAAFVAGSGAGAALHASLPAVRVIERRVEVPTPAATIPDSAAMPTDAGVGAAIVLTPPATPRRVAEPAIEEPRSVAAERRLLDTARAAKARSRTIDALAALRRHRERFENGQLAEERDVLRIEILITDGQHERARAELAEFEARYPTSVHRARLSRVMARLPAVP